MPKAWRSKKYVGERPYEIALEVRLQWLHAEDQTGQNLYPIRELYPVFDYISKPNELEAEGSAAITDAKGLYFINPKGEKKNKPTQIWTQGETEANSAWMITIDKPNQKTTQEITMTVPDKYVTLSNGLLKARRKKCRWYKI